ncbi:MAG TPA: DUF1540 domain-containing protein [Clostridiales bacterium]|nr:DUF1540 domain-containing protein [Clostridiales bacterium]
MSVKKMSSNSDSKCVVNTYHYYTSGDQCTAEKIEVQSKKASNLKDIDCTTFIPFLGAC